MNLLRYIVLLQFATILAIGQAVRQGNPPSLPSEPEALVRSLYQQVVARHPTGLPRGADMKVFAPYLSKSLLHRIGLADACARDWVRQDQERMLTNNQVPEKAPFGWAESGLFSGADERTGPNAFVIEKTESKKDGSIQVYVRLMLSSPPPEIWEVAAVLVEENEHPVIDDVIYLKGGESDTEYRLSEVLVKGCNGPRWVGHDWAPHP
jgi:hypothetical protein